jgi:hypothetical protein
MANGGVTLQAVAQAVAGHHERIVVLERDVQACPVRKHGEAIAAQMATLDAIATRLVMTEAKVTSLRNWLLGVLTSSVGSLLILLWQTVGK